MAERLNQYEVAKTVERMNELPRETDVARQTGSHSGKRWAYAAASPEQCQRLYNWWSTLEDDERNELATALGRTLVYRVIAGIPDGGYLDDLAATFFLCDFFLEPVPFVGGQLALPGNPYDPAWLNGFVEGAIMVWEQVRDEVDYRPPTDDDC